MKKLDFKAYGHKNILATHRNTLEFTKDKDLTLKGDCIVGVNSDFDKEKIKRFINQNRKIKILIRVGNLKEEINCFVNPDFESESEIVIRRSDFNSKRTLGIKADKACIDFDRDFVKKLKNKDAEIDIIITKE